MKHSYFLIGSILVLFTSASCFSASFLERETDPNIIKLGSRKIIRQMKKIDSASNAKETNVLEYLENKRREKKDAPDRFFMPR